jgi:hypothetical protein
MNEKFPCLVCSLAIILMLALAGCVAPPKETSASPVDLINPDQSAANNSSTTSSSSFVSEVTLSDYAPSATTSSGYSTFLPTTQIPADITCRIHSVSLTGYSGKAIIFDLKNPPMYINYSVIPTNVTVNKVYTNTNTKQTETRTFSDYSPSSWFEVTVRDNATREIILQDGFGPSKGYSAYLSRTLKVLKTGDLLVEFRGNDITASASIWVKPIGNFDASRLSEFTDCTYWDAHRDTVAIATPTTIENGIYTWTPENQINQ